MMKNLLVAVVLMSAAFSTFASDSCETKGASLLYRCEGQGLTLKWNRKPYRPGVKFSVKVCEDLKKQLYVEVFPASLLTDHASSADDKRSNIKNGSFSDGGFNGNYKLSTAFSVVASDWNQSKFSATFYDGKSYDHDLFGAVNCVKLVK